MKNSSIGILFLSLMWLSSCGASASQDKKNDSTVQNAKVTEASNAYLNPIPENENTTPAGEGTVVVKLTKAMFLEKVYDFEKNPKQWTFKGDKPCVIDFYADWCKPCKMVSPIMAELANKYQGQIVIYKVNIDQEREIASFFGIRSIPTLFFCPATGDPQMTQGALAKETYETVIKEVLLKK